MRTKQALWSVWVLVFGLSASGGELKRGVVIEELKKTFEGARAGVQEGDVILSWAHGDDHGEIESPFDLSRIEIEQAPYGRVTLKGRRGKETRSWVMGLEDWGIKARPNFANRLLFVYVHGENLARAGKVSEAAERWRAATAQVDGSEPPWLRVWLLSHAAKSLADARQWKKAEEAYQEAVQQAAGCGPAIRAQVLQERADTFLLRNDWSNAEKYYRLALIESQKSGAENLTVAASLNSLGFVARIRGDTTKAEEYYRQSLAIKQKVAPGSLGVAKSLTALSSILAYTEDVATAEQYQREALAIEENLAPNGIDVAESLNILGVLVGERGDLSKAEEYLVHGLAIRNALVPDSPDVAGSLMNVGLLALRRGDLARAEEYLIRALAIHERVTPGSFRVVACLGNLGTVAWARGDLENAEKYYRQALVIQQKLAPGSPTVAMVLDDLGGVAWAGGDFGKAEDYYRQALVIQEKQAPGSLQMAETLNNLGMLMAEQHGMTERADEYCRQALAIREKLEPGGLDVADSLNALAQIARRRADFAVAEEYYRQALAIEEELAPGSKDQAEMLAALAWLMRNKGLLDAAAELYDKALKALESQTARLGGGDEIRAGFRAKHESYYRDYLDLLMAQKQPELAFQVLERSRAQTLLETLAKGQVDVLKGVDPQLLERKRTLLQSLSAKSDRRLRLLSSKHTDEQVAVINKEIKEFLVQHQEIEGEIRASSPNYAALTQPQPLSWKDVQRQLLDDENVLLEYALGDERSYVWVVTPTLVAAKELPKRIEIESVARHLYEILTAQNQKTVGAETELQRQARLSKSEAEYPQVAATLSQMILGPVVEWIKGKRLLIVSDGALQYIPLAVLPAPAPSETVREIGSASPLPLVVEHEIVNLPSASVLAMLRRERAGRKEALKAVAVLADPVFDSQDVRVRSRSKGLRRTNRQTRGPDQKEDESSLLPSLSAVRLNRSMADIGLDTSGELHLPRLPFTRREAEAILAVTPAGQGLNALDFNASRATATSQELRQYRIVHFATHGLLDTEHPELSGLVLSLVDKQGKPQNGFLDLQDIYGMDLPVELVVLSGCETGLGKEISGEGLVGLTRGFMYAGASRVVASLWKVDDVATAELMGYFYKAMEREGMRPAAALRAAQIEMWKQKRWTSPYYWAGFQIQGEWK